MYKVDRERAWQVTIFDSGPRCNLNLRHFDRRRSAVADPRLGPGCEKVGPKQTSRGTVNFENETLFTFRITGEIKITKNRNGIAHKSGKFKNHTKVRP